MDKRLKMPNYIAQFTVNWAPDNGDPMANVLYQQHTDCVPDIPSPVTYSDTNAAANALNLINAINGHLLPITSAGVALESVSWVWNEAVDTGPLHEGVVVAEGGPLPGAVAGAPLPAGVSKACRLQTGLGGRHYHGRFFWPLLAASQVEGTDGDLLTTAFQTSLLAALPAFLAACNNNDCISGVGDNYYMVVAAFYHAQALMAAPIFTKVSTIDFLTSYVDYQRRRSTGHGRHH